MANAALPLWCHWHTVFIHLPTSRVWDRSQCHSQSKGWLFPFSVYLCILCALVTTCVHYFCKDRRCLCAIYTHIHNYIYTHIYNLLYSKQKQGEVAYFLFKTGCNCNYWFQIFSENRPCPYHLALKIYHLEMVCFLCFCFLGNVIIHHISYKWCKYLCTYKHTHSLTRVPTHLANTHSYTKPPKQKYCLKHVTHPGFIKILK